MIEATSNSKTKPDTDESKAHFSLGRNMRWYICACGFKPPLLHVDEIKPPRGKSLLLVKGAIRAHQSDLTCATAGPLAGSGVTRVSALRKHHRHSLIMHVAKASVDASIDLIIDPAADYVMAMPTSFEGDTVAKAIASIPNYTDRIAPEVGYVRYWTAEQWKQWHDQLCADVAEMIEGVTRIDSAA